MKRKPPTKVLGIDGRSHSLDVVTQVKLAEVAHAQEVEWLANRVALQAVLGIETRLRQGAEIETGALDFDRTLRMVRSKKASGE